MGKDISLVPHTIQDSIVLEGINAVNQIIEETKIPGHITGGIAVQSYLCNPNRKTVDLDFSLLFGGSFGDFKNLVMPLIGYLNAQGYSIDLKKKGFTYELSVRKGEDSLLIQHHRRSARHFEHQRKSLEREVANHRTIFQKNIKYPVLSPEDLSVHKLSRIAIFADKYGVKIPQGYEINQLQESADSLRQDILSRLGSVSPEEVAKLRLYYDCLDVKSLASRVGLDLRYFDKAVREWEKSKGVNGGFQRVFDMIMN